MTVRGTSSASGTAQYRLPMAPGVMRKAGCEKEPWREGAGRGRWSDGPRTELSESWSARPKARTVRATARATARAARLLEGVEGQRVAAARVAGTRGSRRPPRLRTVITSPSTGTYAAAGSSSFLPDLDAQHVEPEQHLVLPAEAHDHALPAVRRLPGLLLSLEPQHQLRGRGRTWMLQWGSYHQMQNE